jgi:hypothetical protein
MEIPKFSIIEMTKEELSSFNKDFVELLDKHSAYFEPVLQKERYLFDSVDRDGKPVKKTGWIDTPSILIQKRVAIPTKEETKDATA